MPSAETGVGAPRTDATDGCERAGHGIPPRFLPARPLTARRLGPRTARPCARVPAPAAPGPALRRSSQRQPLLFPPGAGLLAPLRSLGLAARRVGGGGAASFSFSCFPAARRPHTRREARVRSERGVPAPAGAQPGVGRRGSGSGRSILSPRGGRARRGGRLWVAAAQSDAGGAKVGAAGGPRRKGLAGQQRTEGFGRRWWPQPGQKRVGPGTLSSVGEAAGSGWWVGVSGAGPGMHPNFHAPASEEGVLLALGGTSRAACPCGEDIVSTLSYPIHRQGFGISAGGSPVPSPKGSARRLDAPQGSGLTGPRGTAWWARPPSPLLQTRGLGEWSPHPQAGVAWPMSFAKLG